MDPEGVRSLVLKHKRRRLVAYGLIADGDDSVSAVPEPAPQAASTGILSVPSVLSLFGSFTDY